MENPKRMASLKDIAKVMTTDSDLWVMPRYEELHLINILALEQRLSILGKRLEAAVKCESHQDMTQRCSPSCVLPEDVLPDLQSTIKAFDDAILALAAIRKLEEPAPHVSKGLHKEGRSLTFQNLTRMLEMPRSQNMFDRRDEASHLLSISTGPRSWFQRCVERHEFLGRMFQTHEASGNSNFRKYSGKSVRNAEFGIVATCLCLVQLLPVMALTLVHGKAAKLAIIVILIVLVSLMNSLFANTVQATNFGAVAAYSAIVVAFVSQND